MSEDAAVTDDSGSDQQAVADMAPAAWSLAENVNGEGEAPDWFKSDKYTTVSDQAKAYKDLEGKFGSFTGAPESYEFALSEQLTEKGIELDSESPLIANFTELAKEAGMNQDMANKLVNMFVESQHADVINGKEADDAFTAAELVKLGDNSEQRINNINNWAKANLTPEQVEGLADATGTAAGVQAVEALIAKSRNAPMQTGDITPTSAVDLAEIEKLQFAVDDNGNRRMAVDPDYRKMVQDKLAQAHPGENIITVG